MNASLQSHASRLGLYIFVGLLAYMPLHIFLSTWLGTSFGVLEPAKVLKDAVLVVGLVAVLLASVTKPWFKQFLKDKLVWLIVAYGLLTVLLAIVKPTDQDAEILGIVYNTRFLLFFLYGYLLVQLFPKQNLRPLALKAVMGAAALVVVFGILQYLVIPNDALGKVGYSRENGVLPAFFIDDKPDLERAMSTIRDPNSLGSYLIIVGTLALMIFLATKRSITQKRMLVFSLLTFACLWFSFSRSALLGYLIALVVFFALSETKAKKVLKARKKIILIGSAVIVTITSVGLFVARDTYLVQNIILHSDQTTTLEDPNQLRLRFWKESALAAVLQPEGSGPGTAGLASIRNEKQGTILNENYYLQVLTEVGVVGLLLFLAILAGVAYRLYLRRSSLFAVALLASFVGLALTNFLVHIWSNEAVAYTWWGLAGLALSRSSLKQNVKTANS